MIIGFKKTIYLKTFLDMLKPKAVYQLYLQSKNDDDCVVYQDIESFFDTANCQLVSLDDYFWKIAEQ